MRGPLAWFVGSLIAFEAGVILIAADGLTLIARVDLRNAGLSPGIGPDDAVLWAMIGLGGVLLWVALTAGAAAWAASLIRAVDTHHERWRVWLWRAGVIGFLALPLFGIGFFVVVGALLAYGSDVQDERREALWPKSRIRHWSRLGVVPIVIGGALALVVANLTREGAVLYREPWMTFVILWSALAIAIVGGVIEAAGWFAATMNSASMRNRSWFTALVVAGLVGLASLPLFGIGAVLLIAVGTAYEVMAPDATAEHPRGALAPQQ